MNFNISVIIPYYNGEEFIGECLESVLNQTYLPSEVIIVNDGSSVSSSKALDEIVKSFKGNIPVKVFYQENRGHASAVNYGILQSSSGYVALLDCDDVWSPNKLKFQINEIQTNPDVSVVYCDHDFFNNSDGVRYHYKSKMNSSDKSLCKTLLEKGNVIYGSNSAVLISREALDDVGLFDEDFKACEDWDLWIRLSIKYKFKYVPHRLLSIRIHETNQSKNQALMSHYQMKVILKHRYLFDKLNVSRTSIAINFLSWQGKSLIRFVYSGIYKKNRLDLAEFHQVRLFFLKYIWVVSFKVLTNKLKSYLGKRF